MAGVIVCHAAATVRERLVVTSIGVPALAPVRAAASADELVTLARRVPPTVVLIDAHLPGAGTSDAIRRLRPNATILLATVCDPSDGTALLPGLDDTTPVRLEALAAVNERIRQLAAGTPGARLADLHAHFLGHGTGAEEKERWYWRRSPLEPNAMGASEVRRVWLDTLHADGA